MASSREPRRNAGNRMSRVLEGELDEDDFYKTTYGGFAEEEEDNDFQSDQEDSADEVDSDFDRSENDELISDGEDVDKPKRRKKGVSTKAYKEPNLKKVVKKTQDNKSTEAVTTKVTDNKEDSEKQQAKPPQTPNDAPMRKSLRRSTATNSLLTNLRQKEREETDKKKKESAKKPVMGVRRLTQEELMAVAEKTERKNLKSLENYQRLEASRKKASVKKRSFNEPTITCLSTATPTCKYRDYEEAGTSSLSDQNCGRVSSRTFLIFSHDSSFKETFKRRSARPPPKLYCPVTKKPARYFDPLTKLPYYDMQAFKHIREAYQLTIKELKERN